MLIFRLLFSISLCLTIHAESFIITPKKKQPKITIEDCCQQIFFQMKEFATISSYNGFIQSLELDWAQDYLEGNKKSLFKNATQEQLQNYFNHKQKLNAALQEYEKIIKQEVEFIKQFEQDIKKKK